MPPKDGELANLRHANEDLKRKNGELELKAEKGHTVMQGLVAKIKALEDSKMPKDITALKNQIEELRLKEDQSKQSLLHFVEQVDRVEKENSSLQAQLTTLQEQNAGETQTREQLEQINKDNDNLRSQLDQKIEELSKHDALLNEMELKAIAQAELVTKLQKQVEKKNDYEVEKSTLQQELALEKQRSGEVKMASEKRIQELESQLEAEVAQVQEAENAANKKREQESLEKFTELDQAKTKLEETLKATLNELEVARSDIQNNNQHDETLRQELQTTKKELSSVRVELETAKKEIETTNKELKELRIAQPELEEKSKKFVTVLNKTKKQIAKLESEKKEANDEIEQLKTRATEEAERVKNVTEGLKQELVQAKSSESNAKALQKERKEAVDEKDRLAKELQIKQTESEKFRNMVEGLQHQLEEVKLQMEEASEKASALDDYQKLTDQAQQESDDIRRKWEQDSERKAVELHDVLEAKKQLETQKNELEIQAQAMNQKLTAAEESRNQASKAMEDFKNEQKNLLQQIEKLSDDLKKKTDTLEKFENEKKNIESLQEEQSKELETIKAREKHLQTMNKSLKDEVHKLASRSPPSKVRLTTDRPPPLSSTPAVTTDKPSQGNDSALPPFPSPLSSSSPSEEEAVNLKYLRNVVLKFLETKSTRAQLIPVLTVVLQLEPDEIKRLQAKI